MTHEQALQAAQAAVKMGYSISMDINVTEKMAPPISAYVKITRQPGSFSEMDVHKLIEDFEDYTVRYQSLRGHEAFWLEPRA